MKFLCREMSNASVPAFYTSVIHDVMEKMSRKFAEMGIDEHVLTELQQNWEERVRNSRVASFSRDLKQEDGPGEISSREVDDLLEIELGGSQGKRTQKHAERTRQIPLQFNTASYSNASTRKLPQTDGQDEDDDEDEDDDQGDSDINSELDDEDSEDENVEVDHLILCQYEKVSRIKNKWKCVLKDGIVNINGKDYLFNKANGDFEW